MVDSGLVPRDAAIMGDLDLAVVVPSYEYRGVRGLKLDAFRDSRAPDESQHYLG